MIANQKISIINSWYHFILLFIFQELNTGKMSSSNIYVIEEKKHGIRSKKLIKLWKKVWEDKRSHITIQKPALLIKYFIM